MESKTKTLLFDFDGVIVDTSRLAYESMKEVVDNPPDEDGYHKWLEGNIYEVSDESESNKPKFGKDGPFFEKYVPRMLAKEPVEEIIGVIRELHKSYRMAVISSTITAPIKEYLDKHDISRHFDKIYGADVHASKTEKIKRMFDEFDVTAGNCLFITDTLGDMKEAEKAGVKSIGVTWGFHKLETLQKGNPVAIADTPEELLSLIHVTL